MSRNAVAAKRRKNKIKEDDFQPGIAAGLTFGATAEEAMRAHGPVKKIRPLDERLGHMKESAPNRVRFVAEPNDAIVDFGDGRKFQDVDVVLPQETKAQMQAGYRCLRCQEPFETSFPKFCDLCGYPVRDRQILDIAMEFEGLRHLGPRKPMGEYLDEQEVRAEKRRFIVAVVKGKTGGQGWKAAAQLVKQDPSLLEGLPLRHRTALKGA